jgi:hypothetical protein
MDILVRDISKEDAEVLNQKARGAGAEDRSHWLTEQLRKLAVLPTRYSFQVYGQVGKGAIRRYSDDVNGTSDTFSNFNEDEAAAMERATNFVRRNAPGDKEQAYQILVTQFGADNVFEATI